MKFLQIIGLVVVFLSGSGAAQNELGGMLRTTYLGFNPVTGQFNLQQNIIYQLPDPQKYGNGPYPLAIWTPGTYASYKDALANSMVKQMASRGFVGASVEYSNTNEKQLCDDYVQRARGVYEVARSSSAVAVLCAINGVDCGQGIVSSGISQGAAMAVMSKNFAPAVEAVYAMSISNFNSAFGINLSACLDDAVTAIPPERLTVINGENDALFKGQTPIMGITGIACPSGTFQCWHPSGSGAGWYIVQNSQVEDGDADHCYPLFGGCTQARRFDWDWFLRAYGWSLKPNLDWLATFGTHRVFSNP